MLVIVDMIVQVWVGGGSLILDVLVPRRVAVIREPRGQGQGFPGDHLGLGAAGAAKRVQQSKGIVLRDHVRHDSIVGERFDGAFLKRKRTGVIFIVEIKVGFRRIARGDIGAGCALAFSRGIEGGFHGLDLALWSHDK